MQPAIRPGESEPILHIDRCITKTFSQTVVDLLQPRPPRSLRFHDRVAWRACNKLTHRDALARQQRQHQRSSHRRITTDMQCRIHHSSIPLTADHRLELDDLPCDVSLADRGPNHTRAELSRCIFDHQRRREVTHDGLTARRPDGPDRKRESVVLADGSSLFIYDRQPIHVGIDRDADVRLLSSHQRAEGLQVFRHRLRRSRKQTISLQIDRSDPTAQALEQLRHQRAAGAAHRIERDAEAPPPDRANIDSAKREHGGEVAGNRVRIRLHPADRIVFGSWQGIPRRQFAYPRARHTIKKDAIGTDELERVPFDGIVARGEDDAAGGPMMLDGKLDGGCCHEAHIDYIAPHRVNTSGGCAGEHGARGAGVAPDDDFDGPTGRRADGPWRRETASSEAVDQDRSYSGGGCACNRVRSLSTRNARLLSARTKQRCSAVVGSTSRSWASVSCAEPRAINKKRRKSATDRRQQIGKHGPVHALRASMARVGSRRGCSCGVGMGSDVPSANARRNALTISASNWTPCPSSSSRMACFTGSDGR